MVTPSPPPKPKRQQQQPQQQTCLGGSVPETGSRKSSPVCAPSMVTPSPPPKSKRQRQQPRQREEEPHRRPAPRPQESAVPSSAAPAAKIGNSSKLIGRLLKRHQGWRTQAVPQEQGRERRREREETNEPRHSSSCDATAREPRPGHERSPPSNRRDPKEGTRRENSTTPSAAGCESRPPPPPPHPPEREAPTDPSAKEVGREEPPGEASSGSSPERRGRRPDPPTDPPAVNAMGRSSSSSANATNVDDAGKRAFERSKRRRQQRRSKISEPPQPPSRPESQSSQSHHRPLTKLHSKDQQPSRPKSPKRMDPSSQPSRSKPKNRQTELLQPPSQSISQNNAKSHNKQETELPPPSKLKLPKSDLQPPSQLLKSQKNPKQQQQQQHRKQQQHQQTTAEEWNTPLPFKKVNSTPSNFSSFFTFQTSNTTSTSKFWDDVEVIPDDRPGRRSVRGNVVVGRRVRSGEEGRRDECFGGRSVGAKGDRRGSRDGEAKKSPPESPPTSPPPGSPSAGDPRGSPGRGAGGSSGPVREDDVMSDAFSLRLPLDRFGKFDDSDISALRMNDSATVYFLRQLDIANGGGGGGGGATAVADGGDCAAAAGKSDYWKKKYDRLKEETKAASELTKCKEVGEEEEEPQTQLQQEKQRQQQEQLQKQGMASYKTIMSCLQQQQGKGTTTVKEGNRVELKEIVDLNNRRKAKAVEEANEASPKKTYESNDTTQRTDGTTTQQTGSIVNDDKRGPICSSPLDAINQLFEGVLNDLDRPPDCENKGEVDNHGGKKEGNGDNCQVDEVMINRSQKARGVSVHTMKKTAEEMVNCVSKSEEGMEEGSDKGKNERGRSKNGGCISNDITHCKSSFCNAEGMMMSREASPPVEEMVMMSSEVSPPQQESEEGEEGDEGEEEFGPIQEMSFETDDTFEQELQLIGFVPREMTPTKEKIQQQNNTLPKYDMEECHDVKLLQQWNKNRKILSPKSLADDLTAGASHLSRTTDVESQMSEMSENAKTIFDAALKHDMKALRRQRSALRSRSPSQPRSAVSTSIGRQSIVPSTEGSKSIAAPNFGSNIPSDFASWFELPSPGSTCIPLLPLLDFPLRNSIGVYDSTEITPRYRADDVVDLAFSDFARTAQVEGNESDVDIVKESMGPIVANGHNGMIRFANASVHLPGISNTAVAAISKRQFHDAMEVYNTLLRSCQTSTGRNATKIGLIGKLIASTLHNLSVLHLWNQEYDQALPYCRESLRIKVELVGDDPGSVNVWSNLGLINYAMGLLPSALAAFRKAVQMSSKFFPDGRLTGRLVNNMGCVNFEIGKLPLVQSQYKQSLQMQNDDDVDVSTAGGGEEDLFSISITMFNVGVVCAKQGQNAAAISHMKTCFAIQHALLENDNQVVQSTSHYLESLLSRRASALNSPPNAASSKHYGANQPMAQPNESHMRRAAGPASTYRKEKAGPPQLNKNFDCQQKLQRGQNTPHAQGREQISHAARRGGQNAAPSPAQGQQQISHPMITLGSLRAEATIQQRVQKSLEGCVDSLTKQGFGRGHHLRLLLCKRPPSPINNSNHKTMSRNIINYGLQTMKKREAQSELHRNLQRYGSRHPLVGESHHSLGLFYLFSENYRDAETHFENSVRIYTNALGVKHPDVASTLMYKGLTHLALRKLDDSMSCMLRVRRMRENTLGQQPHPEIGMILNNMACVQYELGDYKKAESLFQEALDLQREVFTTEPAFLKGVSIVLCNIAFIHAKSGSFPKALIELEGALQIRQDILLEDSACMSDITENMAHILAIHQLQHGAVNLDEITEEYITMLRKSETKRHN